MTHPLKIMLGVHNFFPCPPLGTETLTLNLARQLRGLGHSIQILTGTLEPEYSESTPPWLTSDEYEAFPVHRLHYGNRHHRAPFSLQLNAPQRIELILQLARKFQPDIIHFNHFLGLSAQLLPSLHEEGYPVFFTPTDFWAVCPKITLYQTHQKTTCQGPADGVPCIQCFLPAPSWLARLTMKANGLGSRGRFPLLEDIHVLSYRAAEMARCVNVARRIFPSTAFLGQTLIRHGVESRRIRVIPYGISVDNQMTFPDIPPHFSVSQPLQMGFIGSLTEMKAPDLLIRALQVLGKAAKNCTIKIYGHIDSTNPYVQRLLALGAQFAPSVKFMGTFPQEQIGEVLRDLHILAVPSIWYESNPLVLCSALAAKLPVLVSRLGGLTEVVEEGINGFTFLPGDITDLARSILRLMENPSQLLRMREISKGWPMTLSNYAARIEEEYFAALHPVK